MSSSQAFRDNINVIRTAELEGIEKGKKIGREEGIKETAKSMIENGLGYELIVKITGLTKEELENLRKGI